MNPSLACDAMCGGLARWLRAIGCDTSYVEGIDDAVLVEQARRERRTIITADGRLLERRVITSGQVRALRLPRGLLLIDQVEYVVRALRLTVGFPRCTLCNGDLAPVTRAEVGGEVPARSLIWVRKYYRCQGCRHVFWEGSHWQRIAAVRERLARLPEDPDNSGPNPTSRPNGCL